MSVSHLQLPVSVGEALDKYSILAIKRDKIIEPARLRDIDDEINALQPHVDDFIKDHKYQYDCLRYINEEIWDLSDKVRDPLLPIEVKNTLFLETFYKNDARFRIKSKLNKLTSSALREQKSYPKSSIILKAADNLASYDAQNNYIRYLSLCYDVVILQCFSHLLNRVKAMFSDDPHIIPVSDIESLEITGTIYDKEEPISNLLSKHDFRYIVPDTSLNYICGGRLGDFIHAMYVIMCKYHQTGFKGHLYITDQLRWGGDGFSFNLVKTYNELVDIVVCQPYIASFSIYKDEKIDINLNTFRNYGRLYQDSWLEIMSNSFAVPLLEEPWITLSSSYKDPKYDDVVLIHRSTHRGRHVPEFTDLLTIIAQHNKCMFITCNIDEYNIFPLKHLVPLELKSTISEMYTAINSCKFFIGNQSGPMAFAYSLFKPLLCEFTEGKFYINQQHYDGINWFARGNVSLTSIHDHIKFQDIKPTIATTNMTFYGQFETDRYIAKYFPHDYKGTCLDIGMAEPIAANNSYHFEQKGWQCLCVEPNPNYYQQGVGVRKIVENLACGAKDGDDIEFEIFTINGSNQGAISSLRPDSRLIRSHAHIINNSTKIKIKVRTLDTILSQHPEITNIDFASIDTEDTELDVLKGFDINRWKPKLFVIENNFDEPFIGDYLKDFGYKRVERVGVNDFFVPV